LLEWFATAQGQSVDAVAQAKNTANQFRHRGGGSFRGMCFGVETTRASQAAPLNPEHSPPAWTVRQTDREEIVDPDTWI
jgi:hypothetical protein